MAALFARIWLSRSVTDPVGLTVAKPFSLPNICGLIALGQPCRVEHRSASSGRSQAIRDRHLHRPQPARPVTTRDSQMFFVPGGALCHALIYDPGCGGRLGW